MRRNPFWIVGFVYALFIGLIPLWGFYHPEEGRKFNIEFTVWMCFSGWFVIAAYCVWRMKKELDK